MSWSHDDRASIWNCFVNTPVGQDVGFVNKDFILDLYILSHNRYSFYPHPAADFALPANYRVSDKSVIFYFSLSQNRRVGDPASISDFALISDNHIWSNDSMFTYLSSTVDHNITHNIVTFLQALL